MNSQSIGAQSNDELINQNLRSNLSTLLGGSDGGILGGLSTKLLVRPSMVLIKGQAN